MMVSRAEAYDLLTRHLKDERMIKHCIATEAIMRALAKKLGENEGMWGLVGLLHDIDYDYVGRDPLKHGLGALELLKGVLPDHALEAIAMHNDRNGFRSPSEAAVRLSHALRASDHLSGLIVATALVMPGKRLSEVKVESVMKKFKAKDFARNIDRNRILEIEKLGLSLEDFLSVGLEALNGVAGELGL
ncbi:MAG: HDIG domain-containing protein [Zestosphaera sp.]